MATACFSPGSSLLNGRKVSCSIQGGGFSRPKTVSGRKSVKLPPICCTSADSSQSSADKQPDDYVIVSTDASEIEKEIERIKLENQRLREKIAKEAADALLSVESRRNEINVNRLRFSQPPVEANGEEKPPAFVPPTVADSDKAAAAQFASDVLKVSTLEATTEAPESEVASGEKAGKKKDSLQELGNSALTRSLLGVSTVEKTENPMSIVFVSSEVAPYSKTGGLADVVGSLPLALAERGHRVMVVAPRYMNGVTDHLYENVVDMEKRIKCYLFHGEQEIAFFHEYREGVDFVFIDHPSYHRAGTPYGDSRGAFGDNQFRFALLCHAAVEAPLQLELGGFVYGEKVVFVANDWHAGLVPVLLASKYRPHAVYKDARCILCIHNLMHQGVEPGVTYGNLGLPPDWYGALEWVFPQWARAHALDKGEAVNILKGAIVTSDRILTVSQGYAWEITTAEGGWGLDGLLRSRSTVLNGIANGIDIVDWNPSVDKHIASQYSPEDISGKGDCKAALQRELGLPVRADVPLIGFIGRLDYQKGPDLIQAALHELMNEDIQLVLLGSGDPTVEAWMAWAETTHKDKFRGWVGFSVPVAHRITAGCDILLMPSRFEPCGLNQLYAMRYGTVPVVHSTGGLRDTVEDFNPFAAGGEGAGTGWTFSPLTSEAMMEALYTALLTYREHKESWKKIMLRGMNSDLSWLKAAKQYEQVFEWATLDPPYT